jgi:hypothetical protein
LTRLLVTKELSQIVSSGPFLKIKPVSRNDKKF